MKHFYSKILCTVLLILLASSTIANGITDPVLFDLNSAQNKVDEINIKLATQNLNLDNLVIAVGALEALKEQANQCIISAESELAGLEKQQRKSGIDTTINFDATEYSLYIKNNKEKYTRAASECRLFSIRTGEYIVALKETIGSFRRSELLFRSKPAWQLIGPKTFKSTNFSLSSVYSASGISGLFTAPSLSFVLTMMSFFLLSGYFLKEKIQGYLTKHSQHEIFSGSIVKKYFLPLMASAGLSAALTIIQTIVGSLQTVVYVSYLILFYIISQITFQLLFDYFSKQANPDEYFKGIFRRFTCLLSFSTLSLLLYILTASQSLSLDMTAFLTILLLTPTLISGYFFFVALVSIPYFSSKHIFLSLLLKLLLTVYCIVLALLLWLGFQSITLYLLRNNILTVLSVTMICLLVTMLLRSIENINNNVGVFSQSVRRHLNLRYGKKLPELVILEATLYLAALAAIAYLLLKIWLPATKHLDYFYALMHEVSFSGINIYPIKIVFAMALFVFVITFGRYIAGRVTLHQNVSLESDGQVAMASIIRYLSFAIATLLAFIVAGINMTGLAIIAGALSVGIGLGLQSIVNNFVCGLILLIEKPIKSGDRIIIGDTEGFVKKVRVRSTQVTTLAREDVIIPNADLINTQVTNYMFRDKNWRVVCPVGVAYGSDVELVLASLLEVAAEHPDVLMDPPNNPSVYFKSFGESALQFELWSIIKDVNIKNAISSELHASIDKLFRERNIVIAFPQRDLHLKTWEPGNPPAPIQEI